MGVNRVVLYARVSKLNGHQDPELQLSALRVFCIAKGWIVVKEYVDWGVSGAKVKRPALDEMMAAAKTGSIDFSAVLVWKIDRFARSLQHLCNAVSALAENKISFVSMTDNIDMSTPTGKLMFHVIGAMAEFERALIQERILAGVRNPDKPGFSRKGNKLGKPIGPNGPSRATLWRWSKASS